MRIGEVEYTRRFNVDQTVIDTSGFADITFAVGIKIRPLLTRIQATIMDAAAITGRGSVMFENSQQVGAAQTAATLDADDRLFPIANVDQALATNGMGRIVGPIETQWWKILLPDTRFHIVHNTIAGFGAVVVLHYRFAELTDDEVVEIAAQRAQS